MSIRIPMGFISSLKNCKACLACETSEVVLTPLSIKYCIHEKVDVEESQKTKSLAFFQKKQNK